MKCKTFYRMLKLLKENIPFFPVAYFDYFFLEYYGIPKKQKIRFDGEILKANETDLELLGRYFNNKAEKFVKRFQKGNIIVFARNEQGEIVGYENLDLSSQHFEENSGTIFTIPANSIYLYDAYILPEYRLKGLWIGFKNVVADIMEENNRTRLFTFVDWCNTLSLKSHLQYGFKIYEQRKIWRVFGKSFTQVIHEEHTPQLIRFLLH